MIIQGEINQLKVLRTAPQGLYLCDDEGNEVLLPNKFVTPSDTIGHVKEVFIYTDSEDRLVATTQQPSIRLNQFAALKVVASTAFGAFLNWGLDKDLFVPFKEQGSKMMEGEVYVVYLYLDEQTDRLAASSKLNRFFINQHAAFKKGEEVEILVYEDNQLGYFAIINDAFKGLIYKNEVYRDIEIGERMKAWVKKVKDDNQIDLSIQQLGFTRLTDTRDALLAYLQHHDGFIPLTDESSPDEIAGLLHISKKAFKKSLGMLYQKRLVRIEQNGVYLV